MVLVHLSCSLKQTGMKIEHITWVSLTTGWSSKEKGHLTVSNSLLGQIVIDNQSVLSVIAEVFSNSTSRVWGQELKRCSLRSGGSDNDSILEAVLRFEQSHNISNGRSLLSDSNIDAEKTL